MKTWMTVGRVSNLPTVWTNTLAAALLASSAGALAPPSSLVWILLLAMLSLLYLAGMLLNDLL
ncbi:UbiA family prenyltransferase, partial [Pseudomonas aeruginosa]